MKTFAEAASAIYLDRDYWVRNKDLGKEISENAHALRLLLEISGSNVPESVKLVQALIMGVSFGIEMEKR